MTFYYRLANITGLVVQGLYCPSTQNVIKHAVKKSTIIVKASSIFFLLSRAWKNVNFLGSLSKFPVGHKLETIAPLWRHKTNLFSWKRCTQES